VSAKQTRHNTDAALFQPFDPTRAASVAAHHLPHWTQAGCTYFVTFRLCDALPVAFAERWYAERTAWLRGHGAVVEGNASAEVVVRALPPEAQREFHTRFSHAMEQKLDELHGACVLGEDTYRDIVEGALRFFDGDRYRLGAFAIMPNHVHALVTPQGIALRDICYSWKHWTARQVNVARGASGELWQTESFDHIVRNEEHLTRFYEYVRQNPARAGLTVGFTVGAGGVEQKCPANGVAGLLKRSSPGAPRPDCPVPRRTQS
jgi:REP element-mobilizing transposase RayT